MVDVKTKIDKYIQDKEYTKALEELSSLIDQNLNLVNYLILRGDIYNIKQEFSKALNDYNRVLKIDLNNKIISSKAEMIKDILKVQTLNLYESTNLNIDPWLDN